MSKQTVEVEGDSLQDALKKAATLLGIEHDAVDFEYDREHLAAGANTVKIFASPMSAEELTAARAKRAEDALRRREAPPPRRESRDGAGPRDFRGRGGPGRGDRERGRGERREGRDGRDRAPSPDRDRGPPRPKNDPVRDEELRQKARELARQVLEGGEALTMDDLNSYERHLVHTVVAETGGLTSQSIGEGLQKNVQIARATPPSPPS